MPKKAKFAPSCSHYKKLLKTLKVAKKLLSTIYLCLVLCWDGVWGRRGREGETRRGEGVMLGWGWGEEGKTRRGEGVMLGWGWGEEGEGGRGGGDKEG